MMILRYAPASPFVRKVRIAASILGLADRIELVTSNTADQQDPVRQATLAYDAVALVAALVKTQGQHRFTPDVLTNPSGFTGIDGVFRFRNDGSNQRGLAVMKVTSSGALVVAPAPRSFSW